MNLASGSIAGFLGCNRTVQAKLRIRSTHLVSFVLWRQAQIHVGVPLCDAERDARVQFVFAGALGRRVHHADEFVAIALFLVKQ